MTLKKKIIYSGFALLLVAVAINARTEKNKEQELADKGGFSSISEYRSARMNNIYTKVEYAAFLQKQVEEDEAAAKAGGFSSVKEYKAAAAVKMPTKALYDKYLAQQAELKLLEEKRKFEEAEQKRLASAAEEKRKPEEAKAASGGVVQGSTQAKPAGKPLAAYGNDIQRLSNDYTAIQRLRSDTREILERSNAFMNSYASLVSDTVSRPISGCVKNLTSESSGTVGGPIWPASGAVQSPSSRATLYLHFRAPASLGKVFSDDQICIEGQVSKFQCRSRYGVSFSGNPTLGDLLGTQMQNLVPPHQAYISIENWRFEDADKRRVAAARKQNPPTPAEIYGLNLTCDIDVDVTSAVLKR